MPPALRQRPLLQAALGILFVEALSFLSTFHGFTGRLGAQGGGCPSGYTGAGGNCIDVNECAVNNGGCGANFTCTNTPGASICTPPP